MKSDPTTFKYGQPLFAAAWPKGKHIFVCGGGGSSKTGIVSRVVAASFHNNKLSDQLGSVTLKQTCDRLCFCPGSSLLLVLSAGRIVPFAVGINGNVCQFIVPLEEVVVAFQRLADVHVKALSFSSDGELLALGSAQGELRILQRSHWSERFRQQLKVDGEPVLKELTHVDFAPLSAEASGSSAERPLAATCEDGNCYVFVLPAHLAGSSRDAAAGAATPEAAVTVLPKPADVKNGTIKHARFTSTGRLIGTIVHRGQGCVVAWRSVAGAVLWEVAKRSRSFEPLTGMDVSPDGKYVAIATAEGQSFLLDASTLKVLKAVKKAHMVFATSVAFAGDSHAYLSTSADASARVVCVPAGSRSWLSALLLIFLLLLGALIVAAVLPELL